MRIRCRPDPINRHPKKIACYRPQWQPYPRGFLSKYKPGPRDSGKVAPEHPVPNTGICIEVALRAFFAVITEKVVESIFWQLCARQHRGNPCANESAARAHASLRFGATIFT